jgi:hypothetical protein
VTDPRAKAEILNNHLGNICTVNDLNVPDIHNVDPLTVDLLKSIDISEQDVNDQIEILNINKATGPNGLIPRIIKSLKSELLKPLTNFFKRSTREVNSLHHGR